MKNVQMDSHLRAILNTDAESMTSASKIRSETDLQPPTAQPPPKQEVSSPVVTVPTQATQGCKKMLFYL